MNPSAESDDSPDEWRPDGPVVTTETPQRPDGPWHAAPRPPAPAGPRRKAPWLTVLEWSILIVSAILIALLIKTFLFQAFYIPSESMVPALEKNDRVLVNKLSYHMHPVHRGDVVVFKTPPGVNKEFKDLVKRVIGLPGETIESRADGHVYVNGKQLRESWLPEGVRTDPGFAPITVPPDSYFVMGDNRGNSEDSRVFGAIPKGTIVGRVFVRIWPLNRIDIL